MKKRRIGMDKYILSVSALLLLLLLSGCSSMNASKASVLVKDYRSGTEGLTAELAKDYPPKEIFENSEFGVGLLLNNRGADDASNIDIYVQGFKKRYNVLDSYSEHIDTLSGRGIDFPEGELKDVFFNGENVGIPKGAIRYNSKALVSWEYDYSTILSRDICLSANKFSSVGEKACIPKPVRSSGQGSPVVINKVEYSAKRSQRSTDYTFLIEIKNSGRGRVLGDIKIADARLGKEKMSCTPAKITLDNDRGIFSCKASASSRGSIITNLYIKAEFRYHEEIPVSFTVRSLEKI